MDRRNFLGRISKPYDQLKPLFESWCTSDSKLIVYEHEFDDSIKTTHCHFLMLNSERDSEHLRERKIWKDLNMKGNKSYSFKTYSKLYELKCITYYSKGKLQPKLIHGFDNAIANNAINDWTDNKTAINDVLEVQVEYKKVNKKTDLEMISLMCNEWRPPDTREQLYYVVRKVLMNYKSYHERRMVEFAQAVLVFYDDDNIRHRIISRM